VCLSKTHLRGDLSAAMRTPTSSANPHSFASAPKAQWDSRFQMVPASDGRSKEPGWECEVCEDGGELILCDLCSKGYHAECLGVQDASALPEIWYCKACDPTLRLHATTASHAQPSSLFSAFRTRTGPEQLALEAAEGQVDKVMGYSRSGRLRKKSRWLMPGESTGGVSETQASRGGTDAAGLGQEGSASSEDEPEERVHLDALDPGDPAGPRSGLFEKGGFIKDPCVLCGAWINRGGAMKSHLIKCTAEGRGMDYEDAKISDRSEEGFADGHEEDEMEEDGDAVDEGSCGIEMLLAVAKGKANGEGSGVASSKDAKHFGKGKAKFNRCGHCHEVGHKVTTCPLLHPERMDCGKELGPDSAVADEKSVSQPHETYRVYEALEDESVSNIAVKMQVSGRRLPSANAQYAWCTFPFQP